MAVLRVNSADCWRRELDDRLTVMARPTARGLRTGDDLELALGDLSDGMLFGALRTLAGRAGVGDAAVDVEWPVGGGEPGCAVEVLLWRAGTRTVTTIRRTGPTARHAAIAALAEGIRFVGGWPL